MNISIYRAARKQALETVKGIGRAWKAGEKTCWPSIRQMQREEIIHICHIRRQVRLGA